MSEKQAEYRSLHSTEKDYGTSGDHYTDVMLALANDLDADSILDYACGRSALALNLGTRLDIPATRYDPFVPEVSNRPQARAALATNTDVLEHVPEREIRPLLEDIAACADHAVFAVSTRYATHLLFTGENAHCTVRSATWWRDQLRAVFPDTTILPPPADDVCLLSTWQPTPSTLDCLAAIRDRGNDRREALKRRHARKNRWTRLIRRPPNRRSLYQALNGQSVALVGGASSLGDRESGAEIDAADVVVRCNRAVILHTRSHGARTDWLFTRLAPSRNQVRSANIRQVIWTSAQDIGIPHWLTRTRRVSRIAPDAIEAWTASIGQLPSTGLLAASFLLDAPCARIDAYGFDFGSSHATSDPLAERADPSRLNGEACIFRSRFAADARFHLHE